MERWPEGVSSRLRARAAAVLRLRALAAQPVCPAAILAEDPIAERHVGRLRSTAVGQGRVVPEMLSQKVTSVQPPQVALMEEPQEPARQSAGE